MSLKILFRFNTPMCIRIQNILTRRCFASIKDTTTTDILESADETPIFEVDQTEESEEIQRIRNKSHLTRHHRNILHGKIPYDEPIEWYHRTVKYKKRMLGRYGMEAVGVPAGFAWPTKEEVEDMKEYERVAYPHSIQEEWANIKEKNKQEAEAIKAREADVSAKVLQMDKWIAELNARIAKKEAEMLEAKKLKERLIAEVRHELGPNVPMYDEKFKEAFTRKEKAEKKKQKEMKKQLKEKKLAKSQDSAKTNETEPSLDEPTK